MNENAVEDRIRAALNAAGNAITEQSLRPEAAPTPAASGGPGRRARWMAPLLAAAAVVVVAAGTATLVATHDAGHQVHPGRTPVPSVPISASPAPTTSATTTATTSASAHPPTPAPTTVRNGGGPCGLPTPDCTGDRAGYEPLWPFADFAAAQAWQRASGSGVQPWHRDAGQTALLFTRNYLGFTDITMVTSSRLDTQGAHVGVGYRAPNGALHTAAVLHLVRYGRSADDPNAGWEVVGSDDTDFSLERPAYASRVSSPMTVGGHITGVDENITVFVLPLPTHTTANYARSVPAGGVHSPWQLSVPFSNHGAITIVASTGGHLIQHERFAIQGVHT